MKIITRPGGHTRLTGFVNSESERFHWAHAVRLQARLLGHSRQGACELAIVVAELLSNAVRHGLGGHIRVTLRPNMASVVVASEHGLRQAGLGFGLGAIERLMDASRVSDRDDYFIVAARKRAKKGEPLCGRRGDGLTDVGGLTTAELRRPWRLALLDAS